MQKTSEARLYRHMVARAFRGGPVLYPDRHWIRVIWWIMLVLSGLWSLHFWQTHHVAHTGILVLHPMPYLAHPKGSDPADGCVAFDTRREAYEDPRVRGEDHWMVTFALSQAEQTGWRVREYTRFEDGVYADVPWIGYGSQWSRWMANYSEDKMRELVSYRDTAIHFAHLSLRTPGQIAYTPTEEDGYRDRQVTINTGRYLEKYYPEFSREEIATYVDRIKAVSEGVKLATSTEDIITAYTGNRLGSCMGYSMETEENSSCSYESDVHPVSVYGESDLAVAYWGPLHAVRARCLVWPAKKIYGRIYGDSALHAILTNEGYTQPGGRYENAMVGARIRAIKQSAGSYVMPYLDVAEGAKLSSDGQWFTLTSGSTDWLVKETDGLTQKIRRNRCEHCNAPCDDDETYCSSCENESFCCEDCNETCFGETFSHNDRTLCESCYDEAAESCTLCERSFHPDGDDGISGVCYRCQSRAAVCDECSEVFDTHDHTCEACAETHHTRCSDCCDHSEAARNGEDEPTDTPVPVISPFPATVSSFLPHVYRNDATWHPVTPIHVHAAFMLHTSIDGPPCLVITHIPSGCRVFTVDTEDIGISKMYALARPGVNWNFHTEDTMSPDTRSWGMAVYRMTAADTAPYGLGCATVSEVCNAL